MNATNRSRLNLESLDDRLVPAVFDLRTAGAEALLADGAIAHRIDGVWDGANGNQAHGNGALQTYLTVDADGVERGYNTNFRPVQFNASSDPAATRALQLSNVPVVTIGTQQYREFVLNIDQVNVSGDRQLSVDEVQIFKSNLDNLRNYNNANNTLRAGATIVSPTWSLDALDGSQNDWLRLRAMTDQGARAGEMALLIPNEMFSSGEQYVYIYTRMGANRAANGGAEQWGVRNPPPAPPSGQSISGQIYLDADADGMFDPDIDTALSGTFTLQVTHPDNSDTFHSTNGDGSFLLSGLAVGTYQILIFDTETLQSLTAIIGSGDGNNDGEPGTNVILSLELSIGENGTDYGFLMGGSGG